MNRHEYTSLEDLPRKAAWEGHGYVYVLEFSNGTVKIGSTADPRSRIGTHRATAACFGITIGRCWLSREFRGYRKGESRLLAVVAGMANSVTGQEWFVGVDYHDVIAIAPELTYSNRGAQVLARKSAALRRCLAEGIDPHRWYGVDELIRLTGWSDVHEECTPGQNGMSAWQLNSLIERYTVRAAVAL